MSVDLYHPKILARSKDPDHYQKLQEITLEAYNPLCGDQFQIFLDIKDGQVRQVGFQGYGCAVSKAATDIILDKILLMDLESVGKLLQKYLEAFESKVTVQVDPDLDILQVAKKYPSRIQCATLGPKNILKYLKKSSKRNDARSSDVH